jgi:4,5-dihydroxyphthalate decarboxylase
MNPQAPYVGTGAFAHKAGLHVSAIVRAKDAYEHVDPSLVGNGTRFVVSEMAGKATINIKADDPEIRSMIENPTEAGIAAFKSRGHYPINHLIAVRDEVLYEYPDVAVAVFNAFTESKKLYLDKLRNGKIEKPTDMDLLYKRMLELTDDPLPYGIKPNLPVLNELIKHAHTQQILRKPVEFKDVFAPSTLDLIG